MKKPNLIVMFRVPLCFSAFLHMVATAGRTTDPTVNAPYNPSYIWVPSTNGSDNNTDLHHAYILSPSPSAKGALWLQSLDLSTRFDASAPPLIDPSDIVPFASGVTQAAATPFTDKDGLPIVYFGNCDSQIKSDDNQSLAKFIPKPDGTVEVTQWSFSQVSLDIDEKTVVNGSNFLANAITFSPPSNQADRPSDIYVFGGMCPMPAASSQQDWVFAADYSRSMLRLTANTENPGGKWTYKVTSVPMLTPPVAEAGFTMTPLLPTFSNSPAGKQLSQQSFVMIGGHTQQAFINMSQIALLSLPETSWSYIPVQQPSLDLLKTRLGNNDEITSIEPRSGHSTVLSPDGSKMIVFGGWVGDPTVPAEPQLVILRLGEDYGGSGTWAWDVPKQSSQDGLPTGSGIFGHGAAMLPGGIMAVAGGYRILQPPPPPDAPIHPLNTRIYLFNITSETWIGSYGGRIPTDSGGRPKSGPLSSPSQKVGLGVGLGGGVFALAAFVVALFCYRTRHSRQHRKFREQELRKLALGAQRPHFHVNGDDDAFHQPMTTRTQITERSPFIGQKHGNGDTSGLINSHATEQTGLLVGRPPISPPRGGNTGSPRGSYKPSPFIGGLAGGGGFSKIHPIDESEEYEEIPQDDADPYDERRQTRGPVTTTIPFDPFTEPPSPVKAVLAPPILPELPFFSGRDTRRCQQTELDGPLYDGAGGYRSASPDKSSRTLSDLSDRSGISMSSRGTNLRPPPSRAESQDSTTFHSRQGPLHDSVHHAYEQLHSTSHSRVNSDAPLLDSEWSSPTRYQGGGESLMGQGAAAWLAQSQSSTKSPGGPKGKALEWAGTVRRAFGSLRTGEVTAKAHSVAPEPYQYYHRGSSSSPTKSFHSAPEEKVSGQLGAAAATAPPRRAESTSSSMLRRKQGARDWDVGTSGFGGKRGSADGSALLRIRAFADSPSSLNHHNNTRGGRLSAAGSRDTESPDLVFEATYDDHLVEKGDDHDIDIDDDEDWDVEAAAEGRVVQVMFTVPKEKLRVVNAGVGDGSDDGSTDDDDNNKRDDGTRLSTAKGGLAP